MMRAIASFAAPSTVSCPAELELMNVVSAGKVEFDSAQPGDTTYQSGSASASTSWSRPSVFQGRRPTAGKVQLPLACPSFAPPAKLFGASGQGRRPGLLSVASA